MPRYTELDPVRQIAPARSTATNAEVRAGAEHEAEPCRRHAAPQQQRQLFARCARSVACTSTNAQAAQRVRHDQPHLGQEAEAEQHAAREAQPAACARACPSRRCTARRRRTRSASARTRALSCCARNAGDVASSTPVYSAGARATAARQQRAEQRRSRSTRAAADQAHQRGAGSAACAVRAARAAPE